MKKWAFIILLAVGNLIVGGCNNPNTHLVEIPKTNVDPETGNLIAFWLTYRGKADKSIIVTKPVAVYMEWYEDLKLFYLFDNTQKITYKTTNFDVFLEALRNLPEGTEIQRFDTCSRPRLYDIPRSKSEKMTSLFSRKKLRWATSEINGQDREIVCYCESNGFRYP